MVPNERDVGVRSHEMFDEGQVVSTQILGFVDIELVENCLEALQANSDTLPSRMRCGAER
mgnify:CR=1 FL=1